jgi:hypothetical protein
MRNIVEDLKERSRLIELQIDGTNGAFEHQVEQLKRERDSRLADLRRELDAVRRLTEYEQRRVDSIPTVGQENLASFTAPSSGGSTQGQQRTAQGLSFLPPRAVGGNR